MKAMNTKMGVQQPSQSACWVYQRAPELTFIVLKGKNITNPCFSFISPFREPVSLNVVKMKKTKQTKKTKTQTKKKRLVLYFIIYCISDIIVVVESETGEAKTCSRRKLSQSWDEWRHCRG